MNQKQTGFFPVISQPKRQCLQKLLGLFVGPQSDLEINHIF